MVAAGMYLWTLRAARGMSRTEVAAAAGTNEAQIERIEKGRIDTRGSLLFRVLSVVGGDAQQLYELTLDEYAAAEQGREVAFSWLSPEAREDIRREAAAIPDEDVAEALEIIRARLAERSRDDA